MYYWQSVLRNNSGLVTEVKQLKAKVSHSRETRSISVWISKYCYYVLTWSCFQSWLCSLSIYGIIMANTCTTCHFDDIVCRFTCIHVHMHCFAAHCVCIIVIWALVSSCGPNQALNMLNKIMLTVMCYVTFSNNCLTWLEPMHHIICM